jgi:uncharacterized cupin superfamily protein
MVIKKKKPTDEELRDLDVKSWGTWSKEESTFPWSYDDTETCYILDGKAEVTCEDGEKVEFEKGDLVQFPKGLKCEWNVKKKIRKHYNFGDLDI